MAIKEVQRSLRTGRKVARGFAGQNKRYATERIKKIQDLRTFFYEYSLFVGDLRSIPGTPNIGGATRSAFLKAGRLLGDAKAISNTLGALQDGFDSGDFASSGERFFRRAGGRLTGKALGAIPGQNIFARAARSGVGANAQAEFDKFTKQLFRPAPAGSKALIKTFAEVNFQGLSRERKLQKIIEMVTEVIARNAYSLTPVKTGQLRGSLKTTLKREKVKGGSIPIGKASIGGPGIDYAQKIEYGEGPGFNVGAAHVLKYFPQAPTEAMQLRSSKVNRRAVNAKSGKGAMMRKGAVIAINRLKSMGLGSVRIPKVSE